MDRFMELALKLAKKANPFPNPRVGAVLVKTKSQNGKQKTTIIGTGYHKAPGTPHAEIEAIEDAKRRTGDPDAARGATLYVTLEPCSHNLKRTPPCTDTIISCGIKKVVYGMADPNPLVSGAQVLKKAGVYVKGPVAAKEAEKINKKYIANVIKKPFVAIKVAASIDGKTATKTMDSKWISGKKSRELVHKMRAEYDAVMVGANTVLMDDPLLTSHGKGKYPYRIIIDGALKIPTNARVLQKDKKAIIATCKGVPAKKVKRLSKHALVLISGKKKVDLKELVQALGAMGMKKILIEGGSELNAEALEAGVVDKLYIFISPIIIGGNRAKGIFGGKGVEKIKDAIKVGAMKTKKIEKDILLECDVNQ